MAVQIKWVLICVKLTAPCLTHHKGLVYFRSPAELALLYFLGLNRISVHCPLFFPRRDLIPLYSTISPVSITLRPPPLPYFSSEYIPPWTYIYLYVYSPPTHLPGVVTMTVTKWGNRVTFSPLPPESKLCERRDWFVLSLMQILDQNLAYGRYSKNIIRMNE